MTTKNSQIKAIISPITQSDLGDVADFLHNHMNSRFSPSVWQQGISVSWLESTPNYGFMLKQGETLVGVLCAIYSEQSVNDKLVKFCNPHSWCVLPEFRTRSVDLVLAVIRQPGYHFTMFSPNSSGIEIFGYLKFKPLNREISVMLNVPTPNFGKVDILTNLGDAENVLPSRAARYFNDHKRFKWLNFLIFGQQGNYGFLFFKGQKFKKLPCAQIMYISDMDLFAKCWAGLRTHLLIKHGMVTSRIESRFIKQQLGFTIMKEPGSQKFFLSNELKEDDIYNIYSELVALDL